MQKGKESAQVEGVLSRQVVNGKVMVNTAVLKRLKPVTKISKNKNKNEILVFGGPLNEFLKIRQ